MVYERGARSKAASNPAAEHADALQYELDERPRLTARRGQQLVRFDDTTGPGRYAAGRIGW